MTTPKKISNTNTNTKPLVSSERTVFINKLNTLVCKQMTTTHTQTTIQYLAEALFLSEKTLRRKIKAHTQQSPQQYLRELQLQKAHCLLEKGQCTITKEIAYTCGYSNPSHFAKIFKKQFGYTPKTLLLKLKQKKQLEKRREKQS